MTPGYLEKEHVASHLLGEKKWSRCLLMTGSTKRASYKTHVIHKQHSAAMLMSNGGSAFISRICIMNSGLF